MEDSGPRRSTLVSRLPIFRRSISRRHDSLPSSPSPRNTVGVHSSSPSSTNSSSGSTGKRRSLFWTPSISFHHKKGAAVKEDPRSAALGISNGAQPCHSGLQKLSVEECAKTRERHPVGFSGSRGKKITRSLTEDFEKGKEHSTNKNVFINCLSSGRSDRDDSGFVEEPNRCSVKQSTRKLLPKSFSSHTKFPKPAAQSPTVTGPARGDFSLEISPSGKSERLYGVTPPSHSEEGTERAAGSLQSPLLSADLTTALTPSEFLALTEESISEVDAPPRRGSPASRPDNLGPGSLASQTSLSPATAAKTTGLRGESARHENSLPEEQRLEGQCTHSLADDHQTKVVLQISDRNGEATNGPRARVSAAPGSEELFGVHRAERIVGSPGRPGFCEEHRKTAVGHVKGGHPAPDSNNIPSPADFQSFYTAQNVYEANYTKVNLACSFSPCQEGRVIERRLRSSSEGTAGISRMISKPKEGKTEELSSLRRQRMNSSSSKMNSLDVLNNLGSCELDEDDLMLDLEFLEEQHLPHSVCREDSAQSVVSCTAVLLTPVEPSIEVRQREEPKFPGSAKQNLSLKCSKEASGSDSRGPPVPRDLSSPSLGWPSAGLEEGGVVDSFPFRLMMQDCTAVKTLLLKMKRVLQESADMSPASSNTSLPVGPLTEEPLPFKDTIKDECSSLKLQLKERDELIAQLQKELEKTQRLQKASVSQEDKCTQTELVAHDGTAYGSAPVPSRRQLCYASKQNCEPKSQHKGQKVGAYSLRGPF
ncbi:serine-rich coiled-coil domain-containing protein 1 [Tachyglossus aculeatus]|uniref:serine-rich coiled-coil domain-containing protein 1 n=1 Tax=Tachyglossus aculeatus TaxID=9261 RepID=UPI0018F69A7F|nr:serine-rich coiled-coil domain-containing protein 1 [Tachyglossus aculeatus]